jgi:hypothetical protein
MNVLIRETLKHMRSDFQRKLEEDIKKYFSVLIFKKTFMWIHAYIFYKSADTCIYFLHICRYMRIFSTFSTYLFTIFVFFVHITYEKLVVQLDMYLSIFSFRIFAIRKQGF